MLKIRISGKKHELEAIVQHVRDGKITQFRHKNGKVTYAIDSKISVQDFLAQNQQEMPVTQGEKLKQINQQLSEDLNELLDIIK